jgi:enamine deaminase RidA (YjgF/YER057c/UK114 family)
MSELAMTPVESSASAWEDQVTVWPRWLNHLAKKRAGRRVIDGAAMTTLTTRQSGGERVVQARVHGAERLSPGEFEAATILAYGAIAEELAAAPARHAVRFWNYIPGIHVPCGGGVDRYMTFNAGRYEAFGRWFGADKLDQLPTASGVGHNGADLVIVALGCEIEGIAVENPRQIPPVRYSRRYGPRPPCFARATLVGGRRPRLLVGGTASVVGEISVHAGDLIAQIGETVANLRAILRASRLPAGACFSDLRIYHPRAEDEAFIARAVRRAVGDSPRIEMARADLCRPELLVEIEGVADVAAGAINED